MSEPLHQKAYQAFGDLLPRIPEHPGIRGHRLPPRAGPGHRHRRRRVRLPAASRIAAKSSPAIRPTSIVVRLTASNPAKLSFTPQLEERSCRRAGDRQLPCMPARWRIPRSASGPPCVHAAAQTASTAPSATLILAGATNFKNYRDVSADPKARSTRHSRSARRARATRRSAPSTSPITSALFRRVSLDLGATPAAKLPTDERIAAFAKAGDPALVALLFQYGRYLMIGSSRPGGQPANLQGIWNESNKPAWDSKYTDNINTEMNYWPVEETNLVRVPVAAVRRPQGPGRVRRHHRQGAVQRARLGAAPQLRPVARHRAHQRLQPRHLADRRRLAVHAPLGALPVHRRQAVPARHGLPADEGRGAVLRRCAGEGSQDRLPHHRPEQLAGAGRPGDGPDHGSRDRADPVRRRDRRQPDRSAWTPTCATS